MASYLIDYENTNTAGLMGFDLLSESDTLEIFFSKANCSIRKNILEKIRECGCGFSAVALINQGNNNLDRYISVRAGELYAKGAKEIAIVSKDKGYGSVIDAFAAMHYEGCRIVKADTIENAMVIFSNSSDAWKRRIIIERNQKVNLAEAVRQINERNKLRNMINNIFAETDYVEEIDNIVELLESDDLHNMRDLYIASVKKYGKKVGCLIYNSIKENGVTIKN